MDWGSIALRKPEKKKSATLLSFGRVLFRKSSLFDICIAKKYVDFPASYTYFMFGVLDAFVSF